MERSAIRGQRDTTQPAPEGAEEAQFPNRRRPSPQPVHWGPMRLSLSEIKANAIRFAAEWKDVSSERAEAQTFWNELFAVFGLKRRLVATFEEKVKNLKKAYSRIDVFYSGVMLGEHKSRGEDLSAAKSQAFDYVQALGREGRDSEAPQYIVVSDFETIAVFDLDSKDPGEPIAQFKTAKLHENIRHLSFLSGYTTRPVDPEDPINIEAVEKLGELHDALEKGGYKGHPLERFLVRVLFCLFADDTGIFEDEEFKALVKGSKSDGSDLGSALARFFDVLDTDKKDRPARLPEDLRDLPYVNGELFKEDLGFADFDTPMRAALVECCEFNWSRISPAVFGSLFQSIMAGETGKKKRRQIGAHYTSERDIMKLVRSLFLDDLKAELEACGKDKKKLQAFQDKLASLRFLDPACGCGNFLVVTYRELRQLELDALQRLHGEGRFQERLNLDAWLKVDVDQMHGIEIEEWPARIAEVAMWLIDHQMNQKVGEAFGTPVLRLPLKKSAKILVGNALRAVWADVLPAKKCDYILGNPPFVGAMLMSDAQREDLEHAAGDAKGVGVLDYVAGWYFKAARYVKGTEIRCGFVSTNSVTQGEQVGILWEPLFREHGLKIHFAHRTFSWMSEARGKAHVHVVIVGFGAGDRSPKFIVDYGEDDATGKAHKVSNINAYLIEGADVCLRNRSDPICHVPSMAWGSQPRDGGHLIMSREERDALVKAEPEAKKWIRGYIGAEEFLNGDPRFCLWLLDASPSDLRAMPLVMDRLELVRKMRSESKAATTRKLAQTPSRFAQIAHKEVPYLLVPIVSSERREYIPMGFMQPSTVASNLALIVPGADVFHFGMLTSAMHMAWVRQFCGRLESRYRYSKDIVYNNYPWPEPDAKQKSAVEAAAQAVLDARVASGYRPEGGTPKAGEPKPQTLADLYDPLAMPKLLRDAHKDLDRVVDKCYRAAPFTSERQRVEFLFDLYQKLTAPLIATGKSKGKVKR